MPPSVVGVVLVDILLLLVTGFYAYALSTAWGELDRVQSAIFVADVALVVALAVAMTALLRRRAWSRPLNLVLAWVPIAFWAAIALVAFANMLGMGKPDASAGLGAFYAAIFGISLAGPVAVATGLLAGAPGLRAWVGLPAA